MVCVQVHCEQQTVGSSLRAEWLGGQVRWKGTDFRITKLNIADHTLADSCFKNNSIEQIRTMSNIFIGDIYIYIVYRTVFLDKEYFFTNIY